MEPSPGHADGILTKLLTESDLKEVYGQMYPQMLKWRPIGLRLDLSAYILDNIGDQYRKNERRLEMVLLEWLRRRKFHPSWQSLIDALNHHTVNGQGLADEIREYVLPKTTEADTQPVELVLCLPPPKRQKLRPSPSDLNGSNGTSTPHSLESAEVDTLEQAGAQPVDVEQGDPIRQQIKELDEEFRSLVGLAYDAVLQQDLTSSVFQERVSRLSPDLLAEHNTFIRDLFKRLPRPATITDIWTELNLYWSYLNYSLLGHVIEQFRIQDLKQRFETFVDGLDTFKSSTKLCDFVRRCRPRHRHLPSADNLKKLEVKTDHPDWSKCTLKQVEEYMWELISKFFIRAEFEVFFKDATEGSVCITWLVTPSAASKIRRGLDDVPSEFFIEMGIQEITIDGYSKRPPSFHITSWVSVAKEDSLSMADVNCQMVTGSAGPMPAVHTSWVYVAKEDSLSMADVNFQMLIGLAGPMPAERQLELDPEGPYPECQVCSTPTMPAPLGLTSSASEGSVPYPEVAVCSPQMPDHDPLGSTLGRLQAYTERRQYAGSTSSDSEGSFPYTELHAPSQESSYGGYEHSCLVDGMFHRQFHLHHLHPPPGQQYLEGL